MNKACTACGIVKDYSEFGKRSHNKSGIRAECRECSRKRAKTYYTGHTELQNNRSRTWKLENKEKIVVYMKEWRNENKENIAEYQKENKGRATAANKAWKEKNRERLLTKRRENYAKTRDREKASRDALFASNPEIRRERLRRWRAANPEKDREAIRRANNKRASISQYKISDCMSRAIRASVKRGSKARRHWEDLVGYTVEQLRTHLEKRFTPEMSWDNYGTYWHIDHRTPVAVFNFNRPEDIDFRICWSIKNLQPLEAKENIRKGAKIDKPFQPSLAIGGILR